MKPLFLVSILAVSAFAEPSDLAGRYLSRAQTPNAALEAAWNNRELRLKPDGTFGLPDFLSEGKYSVKGNVVTLQAKSMFRYQSEHPALDVFGRSFVLKRVGASLVLQSLGGRKVEGLVEFVPAGTRKTVDLLSSVNSLDDEVAAISAWDELSVEKAAHEAPLIQFAQIGTGDQRYWSIVMLGHMKSMEAVLPLTRIAMEEKRRLANVAATALAEIGDPIAINAIDHVLRVKKGYPGSIFRHVIRWKSFDGRKWVRTFLSEPIQLSKYAATELIAAGDKASFPKALEIASKMPLEKRLDIWNAIATADPKWQGFKSQLPEIRKLAFQPTGDFMSQMDALQMLAVARDTTSRSAVEKLARQDPNPLVRRQAIEALGELGTKQTLKLLGSMLLEGDSMHRNASARAIKRIEERYRVSRK